MIWSKNDFWDHAGPAAFRRVASKGVYAGGGSIAEGGGWRKPKAGSVRKAYKGPARRPKVFWIVA